jgi:GT2 family glycosyltransferase
MKDYLEKEKNSFNYKIIELEKNSGTAIGRSTALETVDTEFMMFFDADDVAKPDMLEKLYSKMQENDDFIAVSCYSKYIDLKGNSIVGGHFIGPKTIEDFKFRAENGKLILIPNVTLFKKDYALKSGGYRKNGFPKDSKIRYQDLSEDLDMWSRMSDFYKDGKIMITIPEVLFYYRKNTSSLSASKDSLIAMQTKIRFIKTNLKRRRNNKQDITFIEFLESLSLKEKFLNSLKDLSAFHYRKAGFLYVEKKYLGFILNITYSVLLNPMYIVDKFKSNIRKSS